MVEIQSINQVGHVFSTPGHHLVRLDIFIAPCSQPLLEEKNLRVVICSLGEDPIAARPRRDHIERHSDAYSSSSTQPLRIIQEPRGRSVVLTWSNKDVAKFPIRVLHPLAWGAWRRVKWDDVVAKTTRLWGIVLD